MTDTGMTFLARRPRGMAAATGEGITTMPHPLGIELLTVLGLGPVEHVTLAADLGCKAVSMGLSQLPERFNPHGYAPGRCARIRPCGVN
ncbi:hypothetical protein ACFSLT_02280 [Novosphingobium resinovorum]